MIKPRTSSVDVWVLEILGKTGCHSELLPELVNSDSAIPK
jgi:hypothetical protein|tara:strand:- start:281 stop:400 length:120 start_codon:yes stop_codon:yes gene_type:complete